MFFAARAFVCRRSGAALALPAHPRADRIGRPLLTVITLLAIVAPGATRFARAAAQTTFPSTPIGAGSQFPAQNARNASAALPPAAAPAADAPPAPSTAAAEAGHEPDQPSRDTPPGTAPGSDACRIVATFDFNERPRGNFEKVPMHWRRLEGEGLPAYSAGWFDDAVGREAPPSFLLHLRGGSVAYEYAADDLQIEPRAEYVVEGYLRAEGLEHARAFIACYVVDDRGERIPGSERVSRCLGASSTQARPPEESAGPGTPDSGHGLAASAEWEPVDITVSCSDPATRSLRLQVWILQEHVLQDWEQPDPIVPQEVAARLWVDDLVVRRAPRLQLVPSSPGGILTPGAARPDMLSLDVHNTTPAPLAIRTSVRSAAGSEIFRDELLIAARSRLSPQIPLPELPPGCYTASAELAAPSTTLHRRTIQLVSLPAEKKRPRPNAAFGVDLPGFITGDVPGLRALVEALGAGGVRLDLPLRVEGSTADMAHLRAVRDISQRLSVGGYELTGTILASELGSGDSTAADAGRLSDAWTERAGSALSVAGGHIVNWQLGRAQMDHDVRSSAPLPMVRERIQRLIAAPQMVLPRSVLDQPAATAALAPALTMVGDDDSGVAGAPVESPADSPRQAEIDSLWIPACVPARSIPWELAAWNVAEHAANPRSRQSPVCWVTLELDTNGHLSPAARRIDMARRVLLAAAFHPARIFLPAPVQHVQQGEAQLWQPTELFLPMRNLLRLIGDRRVRSVLPLPHDSVGLLLEGPYQTAEQSMLVVWTWETGADRSAEIFLGAHPEATMLDGTPVELTAAGERFRVPLRCEPVFIHHVPGSLLLLRDGVQVAPALVQLHAPHARPVLALENTYRAPLVGALRLIPPTGWQVAPERLTFELGPGDVLETPLTFRVPAREAAHGHELTIELHVRQPETLDIALSRPLEVGLHDVQMIARARWSGQTVVVEQTVRNRSLQAASFRAFCQPLQQARQECLMPNLPPGGFIEQTYVLELTPDQAGESVWVGIEEIGGPRVLDELVVIPSPRDNMPSE